jgi:hypothetical protein
MNEFGFIVAAVLGATAATSDLTDGMFRHLVITGRSRLALYLARIPAGLIIILPLMAVGFTVVCLVMSFLGTPQPDAVSLSGVSVPAYLDQAQLHAWLLGHLRQAQEALVGPGRPQSPAAMRSLINQQFSSVSGAYTAASAASLNPTAGVMARTGLWVELDLVIAFTVGLGLGSVMGQRTVPVILLVFVEILVTPLLAKAVLPHFINGQRLFVGVAMDQLQPAALAGGLVLRPGPGGGGGPHPALQIPPMPTWAVITVIAGWIIGWSVIGARRMVTRDA